MEKPRYVDTTSATVIYEGYDYNTTEGIMKICKIDLSTPVITRTWAFADWDDRADEHTVYE